MRRSSALYTSLHELNDSYRKIWRSLESIRSGIHISGVLVRDYLLDPSQSRTREIRDELIELRAEMDYDLAQLESASDARGRPSLTELRREVNSYWESLEPVFSWTPEDKGAMAWSFLRHRILPRRIAVLSLAEEVQSYIETTLQNQGVETVQREEEFRRFLQVTTAGSIGLGVLVAIISLLRLIALERRAERNRIRTEEAENAMRRLSHQLVNAQEEERRVISRELHDEVGQMLTGLRMDLRSLKKLNGSAQQSFEQRIDQSCTLLEQTLQSVRDIAMGLRPSMLDDLGLVAALQWQVRDFERRHNLNITLNVHGNMEYLPDQHRTSLYRIVQEGLTNCARHSNARSVVIDLVSTGEGLTLRIADDGVGMSPESRTGLGLLGIQERVRELGGRFEVQSELGKGTTLLLELDQVEAMANA